MVCSEDTIVDITEETISALQKKHPGPYSDSEFPAPPTPGDLQSSPDILESEVARAIHSFPPVGLLPQHLLDLTSASAEQGGKDLLQALTEFSNVVLGGHVPQFVQHTYKSKVQSSIFQRYNG